MRRRRAALASLVLGLGIAGAAQLAAPIATPPLYDGVVVVQPYVYVTPPAGKPAGAQGTSARLPMDGHKSPLVAFATPEQPPQAQVVAESGSLVLPPSATALDVSITPLDPSVDAAAAATARVLGNVYRITIADQAGTPATAPASALVTVVLRAPEDVGGAQLGLLVGGSWQPLKSVPGLGSSYVAVVTSFGDFAVVVPASPSPAPSASPFLPTSTPSTEATSGVASGPLATSTDSAPVGPPGSDEASAFQMVGGLLILLIVFIAVAFVVTSLRGRNVGR